MGAGDPEELRAFWVTGGEAGGSAGGEGGFISGTRDVGITWPLVSGGPFAVKRSRRGSQAGFECARRT